MKACSDSLRTCEQTFLHLMRFFLEFRRTLFSSVKHNLLKNNIPLFHLTGGPYRGVDLVTSYWRWPHDATSSHFMRCTFFLKLFEISLSEKMLFAFGAWRKGRWFRGFSESTVRITRGRYLCPSIGPSSSLRSTFSLHCSLMRSAMPWWWYGNREYFSLLSRLDGNLREWRRLQLCSRISTLLSIHSSLTRDWSFEPNLG